MGYNTKNYTEQGGDVTHFGGKVIFEEGSQVEGLPTPTVPVASDQVLGGIKVGANLSIDGNGVLSADDQTPSAATTSAAGLVKMAENQAECEEGNILGLQSAFNNLLQKLKAAGVMAPDES